MCWCVDVTRCVDGVLTVFSRTPHPVNRRSSGEASKTMDYKSVFTNLCLELQQNRSWIKGLGKNPQKSELIH